MGPVQVELVGEALTSPPRSDPYGGLDFAWRVHGALDAWTGKVDTKASITLAIESAVLGFVLTLSKVASVSPRWTASLSWPTASAQRTSSSRSSLHCVLSRRSSTGGLQ